MPASSSVAQFMAVLSGGVNPNLLSRNGGGNALNGIASMDFQTLMNNGLPTDTTGNQNTTASPALLSFLKAVNTNDIATAQQAFATLQQSQSAGDVSILQFLRQQASLGGENAIVLNLSEKGIPQDVIDDLKSMFGINDLITILRDPKLNAQLDNALKDTDGETLDTPQLASVIHTILNQNKGDIENTITFQIDPDMPMDKAMEDLLHDGYPTHNDDIIVNIVMADYQQTQPQAVALTFVQQKLADNQNSAITPQQTNNVAASAAPLAMPQTRNIMDGGSGKNDTPVPLLAGSDRAAMAAQGNFVTPESIADRLANIVGTTTGNNGSSQGIMSEFSALMTSVSGDALIDGNGDFAIPFEAGFKTASQSANPLTVQQNAVQAHPTTQMLALSLTKMASKAANGMDSQTYRLQLDPPEMGRIDIEMDIIEKTGQLKAIITAEKPESLNLLQRDMHVLLKAMQDAGFENMSHNDLSFNLSQGDDTMAENNRDGQNGLGNNNANQNDADDLAVDVTLIEGEMAIIIDPVTGQRHVNMMV